MLQSSLHSVGTSDDIFSGTSLALFPSAVLCHISDGMSMRGAAFLAGHASAKV